MKLSKSIITGGAGFIGSNLTDHLVRIGHKVIILDNFVSGKKSNLARHKKKDLKIINLDISKEKNLVKYFRGADYVFHLLDLQKLSQVLKSKNILLISFGTVNVLEVKKSKNKKNLFMLLHLVVTCKKIPTSEKKKLI